LTCVQCPTGLVKYIEFFEFPQQPIEFFIDSQVSPSSSQGVIQAHYWSALPESAAPPTSRVWIADVLPGGSFLFQPAATRKYLSIYKRNSSNSFDAICFRYLSDSRTLIPQTF
jgi:hypothetical protein